MVPRRCCRSRRTKCRDPAKKRSRYGDLSAQCCQSRFMITVSHGPDCIAGNLTPPILEPRYGQAMAETPDTVFKKGVAQMQRAFRHPPERICPGDGIHQFDFRFTNASSAPRSESGSRCDARRRKLQPAIPTHERRATPQASLCLLPSAFQNGHFGRSGPRSLMIHVSEPEHEGKHRKRPRSSANSSKQRFFERMPVAFRKPKCNGPRYRFVGCACDRFRCLPRALAHLHESLGFVDHFGRK